MKTIKKLDGLSKEEFLVDYVATSTPAIIRGVDYNVRKWSPIYWKAAMGKASVQIYDSLFDLQGISTLSAYLTEHFGKSGPIPENVPYIRWYSKLKEIDYIWSDDTFQQISHFWKKPSFFPDNDFLVPYTPQNRNIDPAIDLFPYRGILLAARGARTRIHRDPFCSDAVVCQFYGTKEVSLYHPSRSNELSAKKENNSFGGFIDVRENDIRKLSHEPDFHAFLKPGEMVYIPRGWLHDVLVTDDSFSITWNFVHKLGSNEFMNYLEGNPEKDSEFDVLKFFHGLSNDNESTAAEMLAKYREML